MVQTRRIRAFTKCDLIPPPAKNGHMDGQTDTRTDGRTDRLSPVYLRKLSFSRGIRGIKKEANGFSYMFKNLVTTLPSHRRNNISYYMTEKYFRQCK